MILPKLLIGPDDKLYAYLGTNQIAYRFGRRARVVQVKKVIGPFYRKLGKPHFETIDHFKIPEGAK